MSEVTKEEPRKVSALHLVAKVSQLAVELPKASLVVIGHYYPNRENAGQNFTGTLAEFETRVVREFQSFQDTLSLFKNYKQALMLINALTVLEVDGEVLSVAEALGIRKTVGTTYRNWAQMLSAQNGNSVSLLDRNATAVNAEAQQIIAELSKGGKVANDDFQTSARKSAEEGLLKAADPIKAAEKAAEFLKRAQNLEQSLNIAIQVANASTFAYIDDRGFVDLDELRARLCNVK